MRHWKSGVPGTLVLSSPLIFLGTPIFYSVSSNLCLIMPTRNQLSLNLCTPCFGWLKKLIAYASMTVITNFISTSFPILFSVFVLHQWSLSQVLVIRYPSASFFKRPHIDGRVRYLSGGFDLTIPSSSSIVDALVSSVLVLKNRVDFSTFIHFSNTSQYSMIMFFRVRAFSTALCRKMRESSAKNRWWSFGLPRLIVIPCSLLSLITFSICLERTSASRMNRYGEKWVSLS